MKALETVFDGYRFRSRTEARWALFFKTLGIPYEYEKQGYALSDGTPYLPDFWLPKHHYFIEIKGAEPTSQELDKLIGLSEGAGLPAILFVGAPGQSRGYSHSFCAHDDDSGSFRYRKDIRWFRCERCGEIDVTLHCHATCGGPLDDRWEAVGACRCFGSPMPYRDVAYPRLTQAFDIARQARFEHGEHGRVAALTDPFEILEAAWKAFPRPERHRPRLTLQEEVAQERAKQKAKERAEAERKAQRRARLEQLDRKLGLLPPLENEP